MTDCFVFTVNNPTDKDIMRLMSINKDLYHVLYEHEVGKKGTPHLQGMIWSAEGRRIRRDRLSKCVLPRAHLEPCKDFLASIAYCTKDLNKIYCNIANPQLLTDIAKFAREKHDCPQFIGSILLNAMYSSNPLIYLEDEWLNIILKQHVFFHDRRINDYP